jgi:hypothetical protein
VPIGLCLQNSLVNLAINQLILPNMNYTVQRNDYLSGDIFEKEEGKTKDTRVALSRVALSKILAAARALPSVCLHLATTQVAGNLVAARTATLSAPLQPPNRAANCGFQRLLYQIWHLAP